MSIIMNKKLWLTASLSVAMLVLAWCGASNSNQQQTTALAECLSEKWVVMYGTEWCPHCKNQKAMFGDAFAKVNYVDCDKSPDACTLAGVTGYPTWKFSNGVSLAGTQDLSVLASNAWCELNSSETEDTVVTGDALEGEVKSSETGDQTTGLTLSGMETIVISGDNDIKIEAMSGESSQ